MPPPAEAVRRVGSRTGVCSLIGVRAPMGCALIGVRAAVIGTRALAIGACLAVLYASCVPAAGVARAATAYIDGISDQNIPEWDGAFAGSYFRDLFERNWVRRGHIRLARYALQWDVMSAGPAGSRVKFENWLGDVGELGLIADVALTSYDGSYPASADDYEARLVEILRRAEGLGEPVRYVEPWNEPNNQGHESPAAAASFADAAQAACAGGYGCAVVAGDLEDAPGAARYEREYEQDLRRVPAIWGVHPYRSVQHMSAAPLSELVRALPDKDSTELWFTEVAARTCTDYNGELRVNGEDGQAERVRWLLDTLMPLAQPAHVFYYTFLLADRRVPVCTPGEPEDEALYVPGGDPSAPDVARPAAVYVSGGGPSRSASTTGAEPGGLAEALAGLVGLAAGGGIGW